MKPTRRPCSVDRCVLAESGDYALDGPANAGRRLPLMSAVESTPREQREGSASECTKGRSACHGYELRCIAFHRSRPPFQLVSDAGHSAFDSCDSRSKPSVSFSELRRLERVKEITFTVTRTFQPPQEFFTRISELSRTPLQALLGFACNADTSSADEPARPSTRARPATLPAKGVRPVTSCSSMSALPVPATRCG